MNHSQKAGKSLVYYERKRSNRVDSNSNINIWVRRIRNGFIFDGMKVYSAEYITMNELWHMSKEELVEYKKKKKASVKLVKEFSRKGKQMNIIF